MKLKNTLLAIFIVFAIKSSAQEAKFTLTVKPSKAMDNFNAFLQYKSGPETNSVDSAAFLDGKFVIKGKTLHPQRAYLYLGPKNKGFSTYSVTLWRIPVYLESGEITVMALDGLKESTVGGTPLNNDFQGYADVVKSFAPRKDSLRAQYGRANLKKDGSALSALTAQFTQLEIETKKAEEAYFLSHLNSPVSIDWLKNAYNLANERSTVAALFKKMGQGAKSSASGQAFAKVLNSTKSVEIGSQAPDFTARNINNQDISLSSFRGKYVLLDFWASWCVPCRKENPNVLKAYEAYKSKNFTVVGYTMDSSQKNWELAVEKDALPWAQLSSFGSVGNQPATVYGVTAIPANFLIDPNGKIIASNLRGEELQKKLAELIK